MHQRESESPNPPRQEDDKPGDAELARYEHILLEHKVEQTVFIEIMEQHRSRRQTGWNRPDSAK